MARLRGRKNKANFEPVGPGPADYLPVQQRFLTPRRDELGAGIGSFFASLEDRLLFNLCILFHTIHDRLPGGVSWLRVSFNSWRIVPSS